MGRLSGKFAIVTGGGSGIGREICQVFAKEGARIAVIDINKEKIEETLSLLQVSSGEEHFKIVADVSSPEQVENAFKILKKEIEKKSVILVNNAAIARSGYIDDVSEDDFDDVIEINLKSVFLMTKTFLNFLKEQEDKNNEKGVIINMSSIIAKCGAPQYACYIAAKAGVLGLTKTIALEYPKHKVRCNAVLPGLIQTPMANTIEQKTRERMIALTPLGRSGKPEEIANVCLFLASDESTYVHGACLEVTGGLGL